MSLKQEVVQSVKLPRSSRRYWIYFFGTIIVLFLITAILLTMAHIRAPSEELINAKKLRFYKLISEYSEQTLGTSFSNTEALIDQQIDNAFVPVYKNISAFADIHYTVSGEYTELFYAAFGRLEERIEKILFEGLQERLDIAVTRISRGFLDELAENFKAENDRSNKKVPKEMESEYRTAMELAIDDMTRRFEMSGLALKSGMFIGGGAAGVVITKTISASIAKKLIAVTATKTAGKTLAKYTGTASVAATGAGIGTLIPGLGTVAGGIIGGVVGWFFVDKVVVEVDEYINRSDFEEELVALINEQKAHVKSQIRKHIENKISEVHNKTPLELIRDGN